MLFSQGETNNWYFGGYSALNFSVFPPKPVSGSAMNTSEGASSISDASGNLLFYTNGLTIWNKANAVMANGSGLVGGGTSTQASLILKKPGSSSIYFVFTSECPTNYGRVCYSIVDMSLAAGIGSVTVKNATLSLNMTEKLTVANTCGSDTLWVLAHKFNSDEFFAYALSSSGLNMIPVVSKVGTPQTASTQSTDVSYAGYMKVDPYGKKVAVAVSSFANFVEVYDFNGTTGQLSNHLNLGVFEQAYGCEFSGDGRFLYASGISSSSQSGIIKQWDLCAGSSTAIISSEYTVSVLPYGQIHAAMQLSTDQKIYVARYFQDSLSVINFPKKKGAQCSYQDNIVPINPGICYADLPNFPSFYFREHPAFNYSLICASGNFSAELPQTCSINSYSVKALNWNFGDTGSGAQNTSTIAIPGHTFSSSGIFTVTMDMLHECGHSTLKENITVNIPQIFISGNPSVCINQQVKLTATGADSYIWISGQQTNTIVIAPGSNTVLTVTGTNTLNQCQSTKAYSVTVSGCLGLEEIEKTSRIYPNPVMDYLTLEGLERQTVRVLNILGQTIFTIQIRSNAQQIDVALLPKGIYILESEKGIRWKFAKE